MVFDLNLCRSPVFEKSLRALPLQLSDSGILKEDAWVIVEHFHKTRLQERYGKLKTFKDRRLGDSCLSFFKIEL